MAEKKAQSGDNVADGLKALMRCMHLMAGADKMLTLSEIEFVSQMYAGLLGKEIDDDLIREVFSQLRSCNHEEALDELRQTSGAIGPEMKERIVKVAYQVMVADRKVDPRENERLTEIAGILEIPDDRFAQLMRDAAK